MYKTHEKLTFHTPTITVIVTKDIERIVNNTVHYRLLGVNKDKYIDAKILNEQDRFIEIRTANCIKT